MLGEETVLLKALEGKRGQPEQRPPHPGRARPVRHARRSSTTSRRWPPCRGSSSTAPRRSPRSASEGQPGHDPRPGPRPASATASPRCPLGTPLREVVDARRRRPRKGHKLKARRSSAARPAGSCRRTLLDTPYEFDALRARRRARRLGLGGRRRRPGLHRRPRPAADPLLRDEACGKTIPCRIGTRRLAEIADRVADRPPEADDVHAARRPRRTTSSHSALCDHERLATLPLTTGMRYFRSELDDHILRSSCPAGVCQPDRRRRGRRTEAHHLPMADLITRPRQPPRYARPSSTRSTPRADTLAERLLTTQAPQRPQSTPAIRIEVDGRLVEGLEGQTILEVCRDNGIEIPTLCYEPKLPGFGACRMCVVEVEGEEHPPISCSRAAEAGHGGRRPRPSRSAGCAQTNLELIFSDHNAYCLPPCQNKCPSHIDIPGFLKANAEGNFRESTRIFKRTIPFPSVLGRVCPAPCEEHCRRDEVDEAIAIRDSHRYAGDQVIKAMLDEGIDPPIPFEVQPKTGRRVAVIGSGPAGHGRGLLPADRRPRRHGLRARPGAGRDAPLRHPAVPPAQGRDPRGRVRVGRAARRQDRRATQALGRDFTLDDLQNQGFDAVVVAIGCYDTNKLGIPGEDADGVHRRPRVPADRDARPAVPGPRGHARRRHRRRLHLDGLLAHVRPPGRQGGHARLPPRHEGHAGGERGPRGDRGRRPGDLPGRPDAGHHGREDRQGHRRRVHPA